MYMITSDQLYGSVVPSSCSSSFQATYSCPPLIPFCSFCYFFLLFFRLLRYLLVIECYVQADIPGGNEYFILKKRVTQWVNDAWLIVLATRVYNNSLDSSFLLFFSYKPHLHAICCIWRSIEKSATAPKRLCSSPSSTDNTPKKPWWVNRSLCRPLEEQLHSFLTFLDCILVYLTKSWSNLDQSRYLSDI